VKRIRVRSSAIATVAYSRSKELLEIEFSNGNRYRYRGVPATVYEELMTAPSRGHYFLERIRDSYPAERLEPAGRG
jgi:hypothetical protein